MRGSTATRPATTLDLSDPDILANPYPAFDRERAAAPVAWHEASGRWLVFAHPLCDAALRDRRLGRIWRDREPATRLEPFNLLHRNQMMENEPPEHGRLRRVVSRAFARGHVERLRPRVRALGSELLDRIGDEPFDVVGEYAEPLPVLVIAELLGAPREDFRSLRTWSQAIVRMYEPVVPPEAEAAAVAASADFASYLRELIEDRRARPRNDLLSDLVRAQAGGEALSDDEVLASAILLLNAGHEASVNVFGNGLVALLGAGDSRERLVAGDVGYDTAVEEMLRYDSALQLFERTSTRAVRLGDVEVAEGDTVAVLLGAANRDPAVFDAPDRFDAGRDPNPHLAFGAGLHFCLGAPLARMELVESLRLLLTRLPGLRLVAEPVRRPTFVLRGYAVVPVVAGSVGARHG